MRSLQASHSLTALLVLVLSATAVSAQGTTAQADSTRTNGDAPCDRYGFSTVFRCIGHDLGGVVKGDARRWIVVGGVLAGGSLLLDDEVFHALAKPDQNQESVAIGRHLGEAGLQFGVPAGVYLVARATGHDEAGDLAMMIVRTQVVNAILTRGLKLFPRARPYQESATPANGSFPSGHTSAVFATATVLHRKWGWRAGVPAYAVATFVGATRLENMHYLSDVTFGAALGIASGLAIKLPGPHPAVAPIIAPGVVGVSVSFGSTAAHP